MRVADEIFVLSSPGAGSESKSETNSASTETRYVSQKAYGGPPRREPRSDLSELNSCSRSEVLRLARTFLFPAPSSQPIGISAAFFDVGILREDGKKAADDGEENFLRTRPA